MSGNIAGQYVVLYQNDLNSLFLIAPGGVVSSKPSEMYQMIKKGEANPLIARSVEEYEKLLDFVFWIYTFLGLVHILILSPGLWRMLLDAFLIWGCSSTEKFSIYRPIIENLYRVLT